MTTLFTTTHALFIAVGRAIEAGYAVGFLAPDEWERSWEQETIICQRHGKLVSVWQELASLGWQNFVEDGTDIVVRWEKAD